ncbi:malate dehydrogenase (oxaloacetate-decarboxylating) [Anaerobranca californiensis DSM 14826]|jgi:malate dehydrogenase (oxaloacetate-decarboxylating)|uniref:Malate dehydrogenase (Oxaloacetate-decarboxylating) n=1 Tax=Anaerobranca californiensis DSM 14826 TaxID=1120989 RepID=A0A1M6MIB6_9FIRM|nr:malic enzyme-like NAD(P)-binding protein [Anaerobranca californiensis]SHJ83178.1 malate dehydrogenase (oxaloacetate-decarboxylating) [Anaerobranca californiensis DSM 14826]
MREEALKLHKDNQGKLAVVSKVELKDAKDLSLAYSPGVAEPCIEIHKDKEKVYDYTAKGNFVAVVSDGTAVLGLGDIGPEAAMPVMEGKAVLFKSFAGVDAFPICIDTKDVDKIVEVVRLLQPTFGGINLEDIAAPNCFEIEKRLKEICDIPIFHDDQHGTAIVTVAGLINALKIVGKRAEDVKVVVNGAGASAIAVTKLIMGLGVTNIIMCDSKGSLYEGRTEAMNPYKEEMARITNPQNLNVSLAEALVDTDVFIGLSIGNVVTEDMVKNMAKDPIIFAMANPIPEILPELAKKAGARVIGTGRSDYPNQVNNVLAFPGVFRGALDTRARDINEEMKVAASRAIASLITEDELNEEYVIPKPFDPRVAPAVAKAVAIAAMETGVARIQVDPEEVFKRTKELASIK